MSDLLTTKLFIPRRRPNSVVRLRLTDQLKAGMDRKLTLLTAPAGFGKTTLLSEWIPQSERCITWMSLDDGDNDPVRFWAYFIAALQMLDPDIGKNALALLQTPQPPPIEAILTLLLNDIAGFSDGFAHVLDDYHVIQAQPIHTAIKYFLDHMPPHMHLVIASRTDPPIPLGSLRARDQLNEVRLADLRFTRDEIDFFFNQTMGISLSTDHVISLETHTEGWIAGLQLTGLALRGLSLQVEVRSVSDFIKAFNGSNRYIVSYLVEEVLNQRPKGTMDFLLQTSVLDSLSGPLCDYLLKGSSLEGSDNGHSSPNSQSVLEQLDQANLFIVPLDEEGKWYRYHHLFAEVLRAQLQKRQPDKPRELHLRASEWYEQAGLTELAVRHAMVAQAFDRAATLVEQAAPGMIHRSELARLLTWLNTLPDDEVQARPLLALYYLWGLLLSGEFKQATARLDAVEAMLAMDETKQTPEVQGHIAAMRARLLRESGDLASTITLCRKGLAQLPEQDTMLRARVKLDLTIAYYLRGEFEPAIQLLTETIIAGQTAQQMLTTFSAIYMDAQILRAQGSLGQALQLCQDELELVTRQGWHNLPAAGFLYVAFGDLLRERNMLMAATEYLEKGINLGQSGGNSYISIAGNAWLAWLRQSQGDVTGSDQAIRVALQLVQEKQVSRFWPLPPVACYQARLWIVQGDLLAASRWARDSGLNAADPLDSYLYEVDYITLARLWIAQGNLKAAGALLLRLHGTAKLARRSGSLIEILILQAITFAAQKRSEEALSALEQALQLAEPEGFVRIFLDEGEPMRRLLQASRLQREGPAAEYIDKLLAVYPDEKSNKSLPSMHQTSNLPEPLSEREMGVLRLISEGASNRDISIQLVIAQPTVKRHISNIFNKLGVGSRTQAVAAVRKMGLL